MHFFWAQCQSEHVYFLNQHVSKVPYVIALIILTEHTGGPLFKKLGFSKTIGTKYLLESLGSLDILMRQRFKLMTYPSAKQVNYFHC